MKRFFAIVFYFLGSLSLSAQNDAEGEWIDFSPEEWVSLEKSVDRGLEWLANDYDERTGAFGNSQSQSQPAATSLAVMAFLSRGHQPGQGPHGKKLERAVDFVLRTQDRNGLFTIDSSYRHHGVTYCHAISGVMLSEVLGMADAKRNEAIAEALRRALTATVRLQQRHQQVQSERGGWRYIDQRSPDADLSVSTWHLLFLRAAKNANFNVPENLVVDASAYVRRCFDRSKNGFGYYPGRTATITMTGAGVLCLFLAGQFEDPLAKRGLATLQNYDFSRTGVLRWPYYTCYHCSQAASQGGGEIRKHVLRQITEYLIKEQEADGSWPKNGGAAFAGETYATAMAILSLTPSYQILPIYQQ